jgi:cell fate regulator YaaT (PSP1 superfamily)
MHDDALGGPPAALSTAPRLVGVRLREGARADDYLTEGLTLHVGDHCIVEVPSGHAIGQVRRPAREVPASKRDRVYPRVLRLATPDEAAELRRRREREVAAIRTCQLRAQGRGLALKVVDVELTHDGRRVTVLFAAEARIDFRELVRDLAREFRARIEMRQVGARDVTKVQDGIGPCGRQLCCSSHLRGFAPISVKMAKSQDVPLNDSRLLALRGAAVPPAARRLGVSGRVRRRRVHGGARPRREGPEGIGAGRLRRRNGGGGPALPAHVGGAPACQAAPLTAWST